MPASPDLQRLREAIEAVDRKILEQLRARMRLVDKVAAQKLRAAVPLRDRLREGERVHDAAARLRRVRQQGDTQGSLRSGPQGGHGVTPVR